MVSPSHEEQAVTGRRRRWRVAEFFLLALLALSVGWVVQLQRKRPPPAGPLALGPGADLGPPVRLAFLSGGDSVVVAEGGDGYVVVHPLHDRADALFLAEVLRRARELKAERVLERNAGDRYGLDGPGSSVCLTFSRGRTWRLRLGDDAPAGSLVYARVGAPSAPPVLVDRFTVRKYFRPELRTLRDPSATSLRPGPVDSVIVQVPGRELRAARIANDRWQVRIPPGYEGDPGALNGVVRLLRDPAITAFPPPEVPFPSLGLDPPRAVWILCQGTRRDTVLVGHATPDQQGTFIRPAHRALPAIVPSERFRSMVDGWPALVDRRLLRLAMDSVEVVEFPARGISFYREQERWLRYPGGAPVTRQAALNEDLANLASLRWSRFPLPEEPPPPGARRLAIRLVASSAAETLVLAALGDSLRWARATHARRWGRVPAASWTAWSYRAQRGE